MHIAKVPKIFQPFYCHDLIRLGKDHDGGYLVNRRDIERTQLLISLGVGTDISFERAFANINSCKVQAYDREINNIDLDAENFFTGSNQLSMLDISSNNINSIFHGSDIFLKCDIEGAEYGILSDIIQYSDKFTGMVIEFHDCNKTVNYDNLVNFIAKIPQRLVHTHVNNYFYYKTPQGNVPDIFELSFSSSSNCEYKPQLQLPHSLDMTNNPNDQEFSLVF